MDSEYPFLLADQLSRSDQIIDNGATSRLQFFLMTFALTVQEERAFASVGNLLLLFIFVPAKDECVPSCAEVLSGFLVIALRSFGTVENLVFFCAYDLERCRFTLLENDVELFLILVELLHDPLRFGSIHYFDWGLRIF